MIMPAAVSTRTTKSSASLMTTSEPYQGSRGTEVQTQLFSRSDAHGGAKLFS